MFASKFWFFLRSVFVVHVLVRFLVFDIDIEINTAPKKAGERTVVDEELDFWDKLHSGAFWDLGRRKKSCA